MHHSTLRCGKLRTAFCCCYYVLNLVVCDLHRFTKVSGSCTLSTPLCRPTKQKAHEEPSALTSARAVSSAAAEARRCSR